MTDDLQDLITRSGSTDLPALLKAKEDAKAQMMAAPTAQNVAAFERAALALDRKVAALKNIPEPAKGRIFKSVNSINAHITLAMGRKCTRYRVQQAVDSEALPKRKGGGYSLTAVERWAVANCALAIDASPAADQPAGRGAEPVAPGAQESKLTAQATLLNTEAQRKALRLRQELGELVPAAQVERELAMRAQSFRHGLEGWIHEAGGAVADLFGGEERAARLLAAAALGVKPEDVPAEAVERVQRLQAGRRAELVALWELKVEDFLEPYASGDGRWWNDDLAALLAKVAQPQP